MNGFSLVKNFRPLRFKLGSAEQESTPALEPLAVDRTTAAAMLAISESSLRRLVRQSEIREKKIGTRAVYVVQELKDFLARK